MDMGFQCDICDETFDLNTLLIRHKLKEHRKKQKISHFIEEFIDEIIYSSDSDCDYQIVTTVVKIPRVKIDQEIRNLNNYDGNIPTIDQSIDNDNNNYSILDGYNENENKIVETIENQIPLNGNEVELDETNHFQCSICLDQMFDQHSLLKHKRLTHRITFKQLAEICLQNNQNQIQCPFCDDHFNQLNEIIVHFKKIHREELTLPKVKRKPLKCDLCATVFTRINLLNAHRKQHDDNAEKKIKNFLCYICGKKCPSSNYLKIHMRKHTGERPFKCDICGRDFAIKKTLQDHAYIHSGIKPYKCLVEGCDKRFTHASGVRQHRNCMHTPKKKYQCDHCQKLFSKKDHLLEHVRTHTGERPHECKLCGTKFKLTSTLRIHYRTHTGERPFRCKLCDKGFIKSYGLTQHMRSKRNCIPIDRNNLQPDSSLDQNTPCQ